MSEHKVVVTVSVTGSFGNKSNSVLPVTPKQIAQSALEAHAAGASVAHLHVRDLETGDPSMEYALYEEVVQRIRAESDLVINLTTGAGGRVIPTESEPVGLAPGSTLSLPARRLEHVLRLKPELCSLDVGSLNFGPHAFVNTVPHVEWMAEQIRDAGVKPELEVFDLGHVWIAKHLIETGRVASPPIFQLCMGIRWGIPATPQNMVLMHQALPPGALWAGFGVSRAAFPMVAQSLILGGNVRIGLEDTLHLEDGTPAASNAQLVERAVRVVRALGREPASPAEARALLQLL